MLMGSGPEPGPGPGLSPLISHNIVIIVLINAI